MKTMQRVLGTRFTKQFGDNLPNMELVDVSLQQDGCAIDMAVYRLKEDVGVLFWLNGGRGTRKKGNLYLFDSNGRETHCFGTVGHLYGWPRAEFEENGRAYFLDKGLSLDEASKAYDQAVVEHYRPVAVAVAEACKRLGVTKLIKYGGHFPEVEGVTLLGGYGMPENVAELIV